MTRHHFRQTEAHAGNKGLKEMAGAVVNQTGVHLINFCAGGQFIAPKSATSLSPEPLPAMLDDHTTTTVCKVIGGLSTIRLRLDFDISSKVRASYQLLSVDSQPLTFIKKLIVDRQSPNTTHNI